jgi:hypothetical protein
MEPLTADDRVLKQFQDRVAKFAADLAVLDVLGERQKKEEVEFRELIANFRSQVKSFKHSAESLASVNLETSSRGKEFRPMVNDFMGRRSMTSWGGRNSSRQCCRNSTTIAKTNTS